MFDSYHKWLGIPAEFRPPTYYQLLGISPQEQDRDVIDAAVLRQSAYVRNFQSGPHGADATRILTEIAAAKLCLLNPQKRSQYDAELKRQRALVERLELAPDPQLDARPPMAEPSNAPSKGLGAGAIFDAAFQRSATPRKEAPPKRVSKAASPDVPLDLAPDPELDTSPYGLTPKASPSAKPYSREAPPAHEGAPPRAATGRPAPPVASLLDLDKLPAGRSARSSMQGFGSQPRLGARRHKVQESSVPYGLITALAGALVFVVLVIVYLRTRPPLPMTPEMLRKMEANQEQTK